MTDSGQVLVPSRRPPTVLSKVNQKHSLPNMAQSIDSRKGGGRLKLARQLSNSQPKLNESVRRGSLENLLYDGRARSNSLAKLGDLKRNLSASNLAALSDSNLSVQEAQPLRSYDTPNTVGSASKKYLEQLIKRYFYQLTEGCGDQDCQNKFCHSNKSALKLAPDLAAIISIQLASSQRLYFCSSEKFIGRALPKEVFQPTNGKVKSFLQTLYSASPFDTLFVERSESEVFFPSDGAAVKSLRGKPHRMTHSKSNLETVLKDKPPLGNKLTGKLTHKPPSGKHSSASSLPHGSRQRLAAHRGSNPQLVTQRSGSLTKLARGRGEVTNSEGDVLRWGSDHNLSARAAAEMPWADFTSQRSRSGSGDDSSAGLRRVNSGLLRSRGLSLNNEGGLHSRSLSSSQDNLSLLGSHENLVSMHYRSRTSPVGSNSSSLMMHSGSALSLTSGPTPSSLSSNPMSVSPIPSPTPSPMRLLSDQEALEETEDLREFERTLSMELCLDTGREFALTHLTLAMLQNIIDQYKDCGDDAFLLNTIRTVFMSDAGLNASFKVDEMRWDSPLDLAAVRAAYNLLSGLRPKDRFMMTLTNALEILLMKLDKSLIQPHEINQLLIILECPLLEVNFALLQVLCRIFAKCLVPAARSALVEALSRYEMDAFHRILRLLKTHMVSLIRPKQRASNDMIHVAMAMSVLYESNQLACCRETRGLSSLEDFYCHQLSRDMEYQAEYCKWKPSSSFQPFRVPGCTTSADSDISLLDFPFLLDPASKVHVLHLDAVVQMRKEYQAAILHQARVNQAQKYLKDARQFTENLKDSIKAAMCPFLVLEIRREFLITDTLAQIRLKKNDLKKPLKIKYIGGGEQGLDMGGLQKEFFQLISEAVFNPSYGMFVCSEENRTIWINGSGSTSESDDEFELVGTLLGLAIYNGIILDMSFPMVVYKKLHGHTVGLEDLIGVQPSLGRGLKELLECEGEVEDVFCQTFQVSYSCMGEVVTVDLLPNGSQVPVTNENREEYVRLYVQHLLTDSIARQFEAFARGFHSVCGGSALQLFQPSEIELLICGNPELDFNALEASTTYEDGFTRKHSTILSFWRTVHSLSNEQKKKLLHFITGSDRVPLKGLSSLPIVIQRNGPDSDRLPTAMTCFNRLLLPEYKDETKLRERLLLAVQYGKGFGLT